MTSAIEHLGNLHQNPYILAPLIEVFYREVPQDKRDILLSYLVLPLLFNKDIIPLLKVVRDDSTFFTKFKDKSVLSDVSSSVESFKKITNSCLQILIELNVMSLVGDRNLNIEKNSISSYSDDESKKKAAKNLAKLIGDYDIVECYRLLRITKL